MTKCLALTFLLLLGCQERRRIIQSIDQDKTRLILILSGQSEPYSIIRINNIDFNLVLDEKADTMYLATEDKNFTTPEGFKIGMLFGQMPNDLKKMIARENGWSYYIKLDSKWSLGFCEGLSCTDNYPTDSSKVKWIFKRK